MGLDFANDSQMNLPWQRNMQTEVIKKKRTSLHLCDSKAHYIFSVLRLSPLRKIF